MVMLCTCACVVLPEVADPPAALPSLVMIEKQKIEPLAIDEVPIFHFDTLRIFSVRGAVRSQNPKGPLRYHWYRDYDPQAVGPVELFAFCGSADRCGASMCDFKKTPDDRHTVLVVVSDAPLKDDASGPLEFPEGTAFDWVQWHTRLLQPCQP